MSLTLHDFNANPAAGTATALLIPTPTFDLQEALDRLVESGATDALDGVDAEAGLLRRPLQVAGGAYMAHLSIASEANPYTLRLHLTAADEPTAPALTHEAMQEAAELINHRFFLDVDMNQVRVALENEPYGAQLAARFWPMRPVNLSDGWSCLLKTVISNQVFPGLAKKMGHSIREYYGARAVFEGEVVHFWPVPEALVEADFEVLRGFSFSRQKATYLPAIARAFVEQPERYDFARLRTLPASESIEHLCELKGVGPWTAQYVAMRGLPHPDVFIDEKGMRELLGKAMGVGEKVNDSTFRRLTESYAPYRSFACFYAYNALYGGEGQ